MFSLQACPQKSRACAILLSLDSKAKSRRWVFRSIAAIRFVQCSEAAIA
jgi:hypothetical protein